MRKAIFALCALLALSAQPLAAQSSSSSSIGGLGSDIDIFMLPNWAYLVSYNNIYSFLQGMYNGNPGVSAGFGKKTGINAGQLHFYLAGTGFTLSDYTRTTETAAGSFEGVPYSSNENGGRLSLQFDSLYSDSKFGAVKLGLYANGIGVDEDLNETTATEYTETKTNSGTFTPSIEYGKNFYHDDGSMWTISLLTSVGIPFSKTVTETHTAAITQTVTDTSSSYTTWSVAPSFAYLFKPKVAPVYTIYSLYLLDTFSLQFYPDHLSTTKISNGTAEGWTDRSHSYIYNNFFGYVDGQHYITPSFLLRWRTQFGLVTIFDEQGHTKTQDTSGNVTETKVSDEWYWIQPYVGGSIGFTYQAIPSFLSITGAVSIPVGTNATYWSLYHTKTTNDDNDSVATSDVNTFSGFYTQFSLGATMMLNSNVSFELGTVMDASTQKTGLNSVALTLKYKN